jgi:RNA polymerase sigma-B factor
MARGVAVASAVKTREERTRELFARLDLVTDPDERKPVLAELIEINLPLCDALAGHYAGRGAEYDDLVQVARTALLLAVHRFTTSANRPFVSFAVPTITGELKRYFRDHCWVVRPPRRIQELRAGVQRARERLEQEAGHGIDSDELGRHLGADPRSVEECLAAAGSYRPVSLDAPVTDESVATLGESLAAEADEASALVEVLDLRAALATLPAQDRLVLKWRFADECTQSEIAERLGVSQMQVSRVLRRVLVRARELLEEEAAA